MLVLGLGLASSLFESLRSPAEVKESAAIEGNAILPPAKAEPVPYQRYHLAAGEVLPAPPPVAVVYLESADPGQEPIAGPPPTISLGQKGYQFMQRVLPVRRGTHIEFPNYDHNYHSVFSYSKPKRFDLGRYRKGEKPAVQVFDRTGVVRVYCEIHEHMRATILVLDTPWFTATDPGGRYHLDAPPGRYTARLWLEDNTVRSQPVVLEPGKTLRLDWPSPPR